MANTKTRRPAKIQQDVELADHAGRMKYSRFVKELKSRFPWLGTDDEVSGADVIDDLCAWYAEVLLGPRRGG